jgi:hypothetical protein
MKDTECDIRMLIFGGNLFLKLTAGYNSQRNGEMRRRITKKSGKSMQIQKITVIKETGRKTHI